MKAYIKNHILSSFIMATLAMGGAHLLIASLQHPGASQQQEISTLMQSPSATGSVPTLGQIGQNLGGFFQSIAP